MHDSLAVCLYVFFILDDFPSFLVSLSVLEFSQFLIVVIFLVCTNDMYNIYMYVHMNTTYVRIYIYIYIQHMCIYYICTCIYIYITCVYLYITCMYVYIYNINT